MKKFKLFHDCFEYVEGHDSEIFGVPYTDKFGFKDSKCFIAVSGKMEVCPQCGGTGTHVRRDIDDSKLIDNMRADGDIDGIEDYFNGAYDVQCQECRGKNVVFAPNYDTIPKWAIDEMEDWNCSVAESAAESAAERAMGA